MADILCLKGDAAFSAFRLQRLQARLVTAVSDIESVAADFWHVVAQKRALTADERAKLEADPSLIANAVQECIRYVTPAQRHALEDRAILQVRHETYLKARERNPARWSRDTRDWSPIEAVTLNPERDAAIHIHAEDIKQLAA